MAHRVPATLTSSSKVVSTWPKHGTPPAPATAAGCGRCRKPRPRQTSRRGLPSPPPQLCQRNPDTPPRRLSDCRESCQRPTGKWTAGTALRQGGVASRLEPKGRSANCHPFLRSTGLNRPRRYSHPPARFRPVKPPKALMDSLNPFGPQCDLRDLVPVRRHRFTSLTPRSSCILPRVI